MRRLYARVEIMATHFHASAKIEQDRAEVLIANELLLKVRGQMVPLEGLLVIKEHGTVRSYTIDANMRTAKEVQADEQEFWRRMGEATTKAHDAGYKDGYTDGNAEAHASWWEMSRWKRFLWVFK